MPIVPKADPVSTVRPAALSSPKQQASGSANAFGANVAGAVGQISDVVSEGVFKELAAQNETRAKELDVEFSQALRAMQFAPGTGYYNKRGEDAFKSAPLFEEAAEQLRVDFIGRAENASQAGMLGNATRQRVEQAKGGVARHAQKEYQAWINAASQARIDDSVQEIIANYNNPEYINVIKASGRNEILERAGRTGQDPEVTQAELRVYDSNIHSGTVQHLTQIDVRGARAYFEEHKQDIDGDLHAKLIRAIRVAEDGDLATDWGHYAQLSAMSVDNQGGFIQEDLDKYDLSGQHRAFFLNLQRTTRSNRAKGAEEVKSIGSAMTLSKRSLEEAGIKTSGKLTKKHKTRLDQFQGALLQEMEHYRNTHDRRDPSEPEMVEMIDKLLIQGTVPGTGLLNIGDTEYFADEAFVFETDKQVLIPFDEIPDADITGITAAHRRGYGRDPTPDEVRSLYTQSQLERQR